MTTNVLPRFFYESQCRQPSLEVTPIALATSPANSAHACSSKCPSVTQSFRRSLISVRQRTPAVYKISMWTAFSQCCCFLLLSWPTNMWPR